MDERWKQLCEQAAIEQDPDKLMELVAEINRLLGEKEERLKANRERNDVPRVEAADCLSTASKRTVLSR